MIPDEIVVPDWLIELYANTVGLIMGLVPDINLGGFIIPDWLVLIGLAALVSGSLNERTRRRELAEAIRQGQQKAPGPHGTGGE